MKQTERLPKLSKKTTKAIRILNTTKRKLDKAENKLYKAQDKVLKKEPKNKENERRKNEKNVQSKLQFNVQKSKLFFTKNSENTTRNLKNTEQIILTFPQIARHKNFHKESEEKELQKNNNNVRSKLKFKKEKLKSNFAEDSETDVKKSSVNCKNPVVINESPKRLEDLKKPISNNKHKILTLPQRAVLKKIHKEIEENEDDNIGLKTIHTSEKTVELAVKKTMQIHRYHKLKPYRKLAKAENKATKAKVKHEYAKVRSKSYNTKLKQDKSTRQGSIQNSNSYTVKSNNLSKFRQKKAIKRKYAKTYRSTYKSFGSTIRKTGKKGFTLLKKSVVLVLKDPKVLVVLFIILIFIIFISSISSTTSVIFQGTLNSIVSTSYTSEDEELLKVEENYTDKEIALQEKVQAIETDYPGYDEYNYELAEIGHNPHALASYLTALFINYKANDVSKELEELFILQYKLEITETIEIRYRTETKTDYWTDENGIEHSQNYKVEVPYNYYILDIKLVNNSIDRLVVDLLNSEQLKMYRVYRQTKGNKPDLFNDSIQSSVPPLDYEIPAHLLTDPDFASIIKEAEKYIGYPYVWGGSNPSTSFDCSGFVYWVLNESNNANFGRTTAQGIFNLSREVSASEVKPGDLIFFQGTYNTADTVTHIGIYVGNGMMIHAGDPIGYADTTTSFWSSHFYAYGRITN